MYALHTRFSTFGADLNAQSVITKKRKKILNRSSVGESLLRVRCWLGDACLPACLPLPHNNPEEKCVFAEQDKKAFFFCPKIDALFFSCFAAEVEKKLLHILLAVQEKKRERASKHSVFPQNFQNFLSSFFFPLPPLLLLPPFLPPTQGHPAPTEMCLLLFTARTRARRSKNGALFFLSISKPTTGDPFSMRASLNHFFLNACSGSLLSPSPPSFSLFGSSLSAWPLPRKKSFHSLSSLFLLLLLLLLPSKSDRERERGFNFNVTCLAEASDIISLTPP